MDRLIAWALDSERDWCLQTFGARWPFITGLVFVMTVAFWGGLR
jgi:hypothetical protein